MFVSTTEESARKGFDRMTENHELTVLHDDGLYRHIRIAAPGTRMWGWDLVTWPGYLSISGDIGDYTFSRLPDMFEFFAIPEGRAIDYNYWAEKVQNHDARDGARVHSPELAKQLVVENFWEQRVSCEYKLTPVWQDLRSSLLEEYVLEDENEFRRVLDSWEHGDFSFSDTWEWDTRVWSDRFVTVCLAIAMGVRMYREATKEETK